MTSSTPKKIIIIGGSSGIGRTLATLYAKDGHRVGITGRRDALLRELKDQFPGQVETACFDVTGTENIPQLETLIQKLGGMDLLIYNSGYGEVSKTLDWSIEKATTQINVNGFLEIAVYGFNYFARQGHGHLAGISSLASAAGNGLAPAYSASKAFMSNYLEGLYIKARKMKLAVTITDIQPGFVDTKMAKGEQRFWVSPVGKAAHQIVRALEQKRFRVYITRRWWLIAQLIKLLPGALYRRIA
ncbi:MAG TPA: SDR family NAD(P)-dependent oxidoreductase [Chitinophagaceae bacterium]|jgi:short-subunit dehydrogenase